MNSAVYILLPLTVMLITAVLLPLVRNDYWVFRILEYPRFQKFILCLGTLIAWTVFLDQGGLAAMVSVAALFLCCVYLFYKIFPYTKLSAREMISVSAAKANSQIKLFTANVYQDNKNYSRLMQQVESTDPDLVFLVETDKKWEEGLDNLRKKYPYKLSKPLSNTYGMLLYSRLEFVEAEIKFLVDSEVPSAHLVVNLASGQEVQLYGLHPKPPVPGEDERTTAKDRELMKVAEFAAKSKFPVIVMGDLNDVAWSYTTELFRKTSHLLDPRRGRGFYSTYSARNPLMRFPLDYVFCSNDFGLVTMKRLPKNGSDHFAMFIHLQFDQALKAKQKVPVAEKDELKRAEHKKAGEA